VLPEEWRKAKELIAEALRRPVDERARFLAECCTDLTLRSEIETLLQHAGDADFLESRTENSSSSDDAVSILPGTRLGRYEIISILGTGGMGQVY
jgi:hypothetical protein